VAARERFAVAVGGAVPGGSSRQDTVTTRSGVDRGWQGGWRDGLSYGAMGFPLAFVALPLYVQLPSHYATAFGLPLATLGALLLAARLLDAVADPPIGRACDRWLQGPRAALWSRAIVAAAVLGVGFYALFFPAVRSPTALLVWCGLWLAVTYLSYSLLGVLHQAWGARLGGDEDQRARIVSWREGLSLLGVLVASLLPALSGFGGSSIVLSAALVLALLAWRRAPSPRASAAEAPDPGVDRQNVPPREGSPTATLNVSPLQTPAFRRLLAVYLVNGIASAVPATLVLFFIRDRLQAAPFEPLFLASYFAAGGLAMPMWVRLVGRWGLARTWLTAMGLAVISFAGAALLGAGDVAAFTLVCVLSGVALGADLALPGALLAGVVQSAGHAGRSEGSYFGWWNFATKLNLALAAGLALPLLQLLGYVPGQQNPQALWALTATYCALPCVLKLLAGALLWRGWVRPTMQEIR
jgi:glycoside/pentoside/hexuronide:cation symporter, GPH family